MVIELNLSLNKVYAFMAEIRDERDKEKSKREELEEKYQKLLSDTTTLRIGSHLEADPLFSTPARHERTVPQSNIAQPSQNIPLVTQYNTLRSKDIEKLSMKDLHGIEALGNIKIFVRQVKQLGGEDDGLCKHIALNRMERDLRIFVDGELESLPDGGKFGDIEKILNGQFSGPQNAMEAYRELCSRSYSLDEDPREFVNKFRARFRIIARAFPQELTPKEEEMWKGVMMEDLPETIKSRLKFCACNGMGEAFLTELEMERRLLRSQVNKVKVKDTVEPKDIVVSYPCGWCQNGSRHIRSKCPRKPAARSCFDCLAEGKRKGHSGCPGKTNARTPNNGDPTNE